MHMKDCRFLTANFLLNLKYNATSQTSNLSVKTRQCSTVFYNCRGLGVLDIQAVLGLLLVGCWSNLQTKKKHFYISIWSFLIDFWPFPTFEPLIQTILIVQKAPLGTFGQPVVEMRTRGFWGLLNMKCKALMHTSMSTANKVYLATATQDGNTPTTIFDDL